MNRKNCLRFLLFCAVTGIITAIGVTILQSTCRMSSRNQEILELSMEVSYDEQLEQKLKEMQADGLACMFYQEREDTIINTEFNRSEKISLMGIAGDSSVYVEGANQLAIGETGYCLLGADISVTLFGTTEVTGKTVTIGENTYVIAGVLYQKKNLCMYELNPYEEVSVTHMVYRYPERKQKSMVLQEIQNVYGITFK